MHLQTPELTPFFVLYWRFLCTEQKGTRTDHCSKKFDVLPRVSLHPVSSLFHLWVKSFNPETQVYPPPGFFWEQHLLLCRGHILQIFMFISSLLFTGSLLKYVFTCANMSLCLGWGRLGVGLGRQRSQNTEEESWLCIED